MPQSKRDSILESIANIGSGFIISLLAAYLIMPLYSKGQINEFEITVFYTVLSFIRSYVWRRYFNTLAIFNHKTGETP